MSEGRACWKRNVKKKQNIDYSENSLIHRFLMLLDCLDCSWCPDECVKATGSRKQIIGAQLRYVAGVFVCGLLKAHKTLVNTYGKK